MKNLWKCGVAFALAVMLFTAGKADARAEELPGETVTVEEESDVPAQSAGRADVVVQTREEAYVNPLYEGVLHESELIYREGPATLSVYDEQEYLESVEEAGSQLRQKMKQREESVEIYLRAEAYSRELLLAVTEQALLHTGNPTEGDYLRWQFGGWKTSTSYVEDPNADYIYMTITFTITYYTTAAQEQTMDEEVARILNELNVAGKNSYEKTEAVYGFICSHTVYDYDNLNNDEYKLKYTAYAALVDKKAVCQGYAVLFYRMMLELGVDNRVIPGTGNGEAHGWNIVKLNGKYYNIDATWDAGNTEYRYFLKCDQNFAGHIRNEEYATDAFYAEYPMAETDYSGSDIIELEVPEIVSAFSRTKDSVKITWTQTGDAEGYELYRATSPDAEGETISEADAEGKWFRVKTVNRENIAQYTNGEFLQYTNVKLPVGQTFYYKVCAYTENADGSRNRSAFSEVDYMPAAVVFSNVYSNSDSRIRIMWNRVDGAHGYQIWRMDDEGIYRIVKTIGTKENTPGNDQGMVTAYSNTDLEAGKTYTYQMRAFSIPEEGKKVFGAYSDPVVVSVMPQKPALTVECTRTGRAELSWEHVNGAAGYQIWRADGDSAQFTIIKSIADGDMLSYVNNGLDSGESYSYKVRAYTQVGEKKTFGEYSEVQKIRIK